MEGGTELKAYLEQIALHQTRRPPTVSRSRPTRAKGRPTCHEIGFPKSGLTHTGVIEINYAKQQVGRPLVFFFSSVLA